MKLIGIKLNGGEPAVIKNLQPGRWYPFGDYEEPISKATFPWKAYTDEDNFLSKMYKRVADEKNDTKGFDISVSCIVGKNGSGKTSLIDLTLRIINNFAFYILKNGDKTEIPSGRELSEAKGFAATLYFETDGKFGFIDYSYGTVKFAYNSGVSTSDVQEKDFDTLIEKGNLKHILSGFFYTICSNYSIYSFNQEDYNTATLFNPKGENGVDGEWIGGILHKNDGYVDPLVVTPYRGRNGNIDATTEKELAEQRLSTIALLFLSQDKWFMEEYQPSYFEYRLDDLASTRYNKKFIDLCIQRIPINIYSHKDILSGIEQEWLSILIEKYGKDYIEEILDPLLAYLSYKTLKICLNYRSYGAIMGSRLLNETEIEEAKGIWAKDPMFPKRWYEGAEKIMCVLSLPEGCYKSVVKAIQSDSSHITLKIQQVFEYLDRNIFSKTSVPKDSDLYITGVHKLSAQEFLRKNYEYEQRNNPSDVKASYSTYDEVFRLLPPPFYEWKMYYRKKNAPKDPTMSNGIRLNSLSSGEKQLLHSASYLLYHIKNIESVNVDKFRYRYHHINIILDEAELYYHPEYQRTLLAELIKMLVYGHIDSRKIRSVNFIVVTHSPFVLSDIPSSRILFLKDGEPSLKLGNQTFSANIHELLYHQFFIEKPMGEISFHAQNEIISFFNKRKSYNDTGEKKAFIERIPYYRNIVAMVGEPYLHNTLSQMLDTIELEAVGMDEQARLIKERQMHEDRIKVINQRLGYEEN